MYCRLIFFTLSIRCVFVGAALALEIKRFGGALDARRKTKTLDPPVMSLTATSSCAAVGAAFINRVKITARASIP